MIQPTVSDTADIAALETKELETGLDAASYAFLLARYLEMNEMSYASLLWKRIPKEIKAEDADISAVWEIGKKLWLLDFVGAYAAIKKEWSESLRPVMIRIEENVRNRALNLVSRAYSSISLPQFCSLINMTENDAILLAQGRGWKYDENENAVEPWPEVRPMPEFKPNEQQIEIFAKYANFLEN